MRQSGLVAWVLGGCGDGDEEGENSEDRRHGGMGEIFRVCVAFYRPRGYQSHFQVVILKFSSVQFLTLLPEP